jgi:hypothetical protein
MITYTWDIFRLDCAPSENGLTDVVKVIHWILQAQDENGVSSSINNSYPLPSPTPEGFTDYSTLTEETVIGWLESNLDVGYLQSRLANEIATQYNPPIVPLPLPWVKVEEPVLEVIEESVAAEEPVPTEPTLEEMVADGYNPDARDGDGDGFVQDTTKWERPIDTQL